MTEKWRLAPDPEPGAADGHAARGRAALLAGDLDEALREFRTAGELRVHPHDEVGVGDVLLARGRWRAALRRYQRAARVAPDDPLAILGRSQALVAGGVAREAAAELEVRYAGSPDPVLRYYLASTWCSVADQARTRTSDDVLVFTSADQVDVCERAARRILALDVPDAELRRGAHRLLAEVATARRWRWEPEGIAVSLAVLAASLGFLLVAMGGLAGNVAVVVTGVLLGGALLGVIVLRFRRQTWQVLAERRAKGQRG
ncbi:tetratricopeptide repeat protein [Actinokineospora soli]|uniref:Tetratricopeptide repeat protein n=1 Tax=Actinokineospora soli TaxID=1048753 RepID=A0ABW2TW66_9PSEU